MSRRADNTSGSLSASTSGAVSVTATIRAARCGTYTIAETCVRLGVARHTVEASIRSGELPSLTVGKRVLVPRAALNLRLAGIDLTTLVDRFDNLEDLTDWAESPGERLADTPKSSLP
jgi:excisionase family DNA binding protein